MSGSPTPSPSASTPIPTPTPTPPGLVATLTTGSIPGLAPADTVDGAEASNRGLYLLVSARLPSGEPADKVVKLEGDPGTASSWNTIQPEAEGTIGSFSVANPYFEQRGVADFYYVASNDRVQTPIGGRQLIWGRYSTVAGKSARASEDQAQGPAGPVAVAAGNPTGSDQQKSWILYTFASTASYVVRQDDGVYTHGGTTLADRFSDTASPTVTGSLIGTNYNKVVSNPTDARLYLIVNGTLYVYSSAMQLGNYVLSTTRSPTDTMIFYNGALYIGYEEGVWRLVADGTLTKILTKDAKENFCIRDGEVYLGKGEAVNLQTIARRNWISTGTLTADQATQANTIRGTGPYRIYCSATAASPVIYAPVGGTQQVKVIKPLTP